MNEELFDPAKVQEIISTIPKFEPTIKPTLEQVPEIAPPSEPKQEDILRGSFTLASEVNPDEYARQVKLANALGIDPKAVPSYEQLAKKKALFKEAEIDTLPETNPGVADFLVTPHHAKLAQDDVKNLSFLENVMKEIGVVQDLGPGANIGLLQTEMLQLEGKLRRQGLSYDEERRLEAVQKAMATAQEKLSSGGSAFGGAGQLGGLILSMQPEAATWGLAGARAGVWVGGVAPNLIPGAAALPEEMFTAPLGATVFGKAAYDINMIKQMYELEGESAYIESIDAGDPQWRAELNKVIVGSTNAFLEFMPFSIFRKSISTPLRRVLARRSSQKVATELAKPSVGKALATGGKELAKLVGAESSTEGLQKLVSDGVPEIMRAATEAGYEITPERAEEVLVGALVETYTAAKAMTILGGIGPSFGVYADLQRVGKAKEQANLLQRLADGTAASKTKVRSTEAFSLFLQAQAKGAQVENIYLDTDQVAGTLQQMGLNTEQLRAVSPELADQLEDPGNTGGLVSVPLGDYMAQVSGTDLGNALQPHLKTSPDAFSLFEAQEFEKSKASMLADAEQQVDEKIATDITFAESAGNVKRTIVEQYKAAGVKAVTDEQINASAEIGKTMASHLAIQLGITPEEAWGRMVQAVKPGEAVTPQMLEQIPATIDIEGIQRPTTNTAGIQLASTEEGVRNFWKWFGDSKVVDTEGRPLVVFHGAQLKFDEFDVSKSSGVAGAGAYFAEDGSISALYGEHIVSAYLSLKNPIDLRGGDKVIFDTQQKLLGRNMRSAVNIPALTEIAKDFAAALQKEGYDGVIMDAEGPRGAYYVAFSPRQIKSVENVGAFSPETANIYQQQAQGGFDPNTLTIALFKTANFSTFTHELGHAYLNMLTNLQDTPPALQADIDELMAWFGIESVKKWNSMTVDEQRPYHEQFARGFETYLFEGKAPSPKLERLFQRVAKWMRDIYGTIARIDEDYKAQTGKDLPALTPEVRSVFDRMLASERQIAEMEQMEGMKALFGAKPTGMDEITWAAYQDMQEEARNNAIGKLTASVLRELKWYGNARSKVLKGLQGEAKAQRRKIRAEVQSELESSPLYIAINFLKTGYLGYGDDALAFMPGGDIDPGVSHRLSTEKVRAMFPTGQVLGDVPNYKKLGFGKGGMLAKDGMDPEFVAEMFRDVYPGEQMFDTAEIMVRHLIDAPSLKKAIDARTDQRMLAEHSDMLNAEDIDLKIREALHNKILSKMVAAELRFLTGATAPVNVMTKAARAIARDMLMNVKVKALKPRTYSVTANRAGRTAEHRVKKGDMRGAARAKQGQLLQTEAAREAIELRGAINKWVKKVSKYSKASIRKNMGAEASEQVLNILARFELAAPLSNAEQTARRPLSEHIAEIEAEGYFGYSANIPEFIRNESFSKSYTDLTVGEMHDVIYAVDSLAKLGRKAVADRNAANKESIVARAVLAEQTITKNKLGKKKRIVAQTKVERGMKRAEAFKWYNLSLASICRIFDGDVDNGPMYRMLVAPANERGDWETEMKANAAVTLERIFKDAFGETMVSVPFTQKKVQIPGITQGDYADGMTLNTIFAVALNSGNEGNLTRLMNGESWTEAQVYAVLSQLTEAQLKAVQEVWDYYETFRPMIAEQERRRMGREPKWVEPKPLVVTSSDGKRVELRGGYFPIRYDAERTVRLRPGQNYEGMTGDPMEEIRRQVTTSHGFAMPRAEEMEQNAPILLDSNTMFIGINTVIHDLAWRDLLIDMNKLVNHPTFRAAVLDNYGPNALNHLRQWIYDVASGHQQLSDGAKLVQMLGHNVSFSRMAYSMTTLVKQPLGVIQSIPWLGEGNITAGVSHLFHGITRYMSDPKGMHAWIAEQSSFMRMRGSTLIRDLNELRNVLHGESTLWKQVKVNGFTLIAKSQSIVDAVTWLAAYDKNVVAMGEKDAARVADQTVKSSQGSGLLHDLPASMREEGLMRIFTSFYSYRNATFNRLVVSGMTNESKAQFAAEATLLLIVQVMLERLLMEVISGPGDDDEGKNALERTLMHAPADVTAFTFGLVPVGSEVSSLGETLFPTGEYAPSYRGPARLSIFRDITDSATQLRQMEWDRAARRAIVNTLGDASGLPSAQINRTLDGIDALIEEEVDNPVEVPIMLMFGTQ